MWVIENETPYATERGAAIDNRGAKHWIVVVKATFTIHPDGALEAAKEQLPPLLMAEYRGKPGESSLLYEGDVVCGKSATDLVVNGSAHAPGGRPATEVLVTLAFEGRRKTLLVRGDRRYEKDWSGVVTASPVEPFLRLPIVYERAYGGYDHLLPDVKNHTMFPPNPVGAGVATHPEHLIGKPLPNIEFENGPSRADAAAGFGALCSYWEPRRRYQGTYDENWAKTQKPLLPLDHDERWNHCAPIDQQIEPHARGGETVQLVNMSPSGFLSFTLPKHYFAFTTHFAPSSKRAPMEHRAKLHSVIVEPDASRLMMVWHSKLSCGNALDDIDKTVVTEKAYV